MAKYSNTVQYNLKTTLDASGISKLQSELNKVQREIDRINTAGFMPKESLASAKKNITEIQTALQKAFNPNIGLLNLDKFTASLSAGNRSVADWAKSFSVAGTQGQQSMNALIGRLGKIDTGLTSVSKTTDKVFNTIGNTVRWGLIASAFQTIMNNVHEAVDYVKELDRSLTDIRIVTDYSAQDMRKFSLEANKAAQALGQTTVAYTDATTIYAQQGFDIKDSEKLAELTMKIANTTGQETSEASSQITSFMNGFQLSIDEVATGLDKVAKVAAVGAADVNELMTAASKVASTANMLGVTEDQLVTQMSTIISVTREAPENVGNALKTIYARLGDLQMGETLEDGTSLGNLSKTLQNIGIEVMDANGAMRNMGDIIEDLMGKWKDLDQAQQQALAVKLAGKYQYSRFSALMQNEEMYKSQLQDSINSSGALDEMQSDYMEGVEGKTKSLEAAVEGLISKIVDPNSLKPLTDGLTGVVNLAENFVDAIGGSIPLLTLMGSLVTKIFSKNIAQGINSMVNNQELKSETKQTELARQKLFDLSADKSIINDSNHNLTKFVSNTAKYSNQMSEQQIEQYNKLLQQSVDIENARIEAKKEVAEVERIIKQEMVAEYGIADPDEYKNENGQIDISKVRRIHSKQRAALNDNLATYGETYDNLDMAGGSVGAGQTALDNYFKSNKDAQDYAIVLQKLNNEMNTLSPSINRLTNDFKLLGSEKKELTNLYTALESELAKEEKDLIKISGLYEQLGRLIDKNKIATEQKIGASREEIQTSDRVAQAFENEANAAEQSATMLERQKQFEDNVARQANIERVVGLAGGITQLSFGLQSLNNISTIISRSLEGEVSSWEAFSQVILNLSMGVPMVVTSFKQLKEGVQGAKALLNTESAIKAKLAETAAKVASAEVSYKEAKAEADEAAKSGMATSQAVKEAKAKELEAKAKLDSAKASRKETLAEQESQSIEYKIKNGLKKGIASISKAGWAGIGIGLAAAVTAAIIKGQIEANKALYNAKWDKASKAIEENTAFNEQLGDFKAQYKEYQETGAMSEEFVENLKTLGKSLNVVGAETLVESGHFDKLAKKIQEIDTTKVDEVLNATNAFLNGSGVDALNAGLFQNGYLYSGGVKDTLENALPSTDYIEGWDGAYIESRNALGEEIKNSKSAAEAIGIAVKKRTEYEKEIASLSKKAQELRNKGLEDEAKAYELQIEGKQESVNKLNKVLEEDEKVTNYRQALQESANISAKQILDDGEFHTIDEAMASLKQNSHIADYMDTLGSWGSQLQIIIDNTNNEILKIAAQLEQSKFDLEESLADKIGDYANQGLIRGFDANSMTSSDLAHSMVLQLTESMNKKGMTDSEQLQFLAEFDTTPESFEKLQQQIDDFTAINPVKLKGLIDTEGSLNFSKEETKDVLDTAGVSESGFNRMVGHYFEQNDKGQYKDDNGFTKRAKELQKEIKLNKDNVDKVKALRTEYENVEEAAEDVTLMNLNMNNGVKKLINTWEEVGDIITDKAKVGSAEWLQALGSIDESVSQILNIDEGALSEQFYIDPENIDTIEEIAQGGERAGKAIDKLRKAATEDLIMHLNIDASKLEDGETVSGIIESLQNQFKEFTENNDSLKIGDYIDTTADTSGFMQSMSELLESGKITSEQLSTILSSYGMSGTIDYKESETYVPEYTYNVEPIGPKKIQTGSDADGNLAETEVAQYKVTSYQSGTKKMKGTVPYLKGAHYTGKGVTSVTPKLDTGGSKSGGGGGSSKKSSPSKKQKKEPYKKDLYAKNNRDLEKRNHLLEDIDKNRKGSEYTDALNKENKLLLEQINLLKERKDIEKKDFNSLKKKYTTGTVFGTGKKYGLKIGGDEKKGEAYFTNYESKMEAAYKTYNKYVAEYNKKDTKESRRKVLEKLIEKQEKYISGLEDAKQALEDYNEEVRDTIEKEKELYRQIRQNRMDHLDKKLKGLDELKDLKTTLIEINSVLSGMSSDNPFRAMAEESKKLANFTSLSSDNITSFYQKQIDAAKAKKKEEGQTNSDKAYLDWYIEQMENKKAQALSGEGDGLGWLDLTTDNLETILAIPSFYGDEKDLANQMDFSFEDYWELAKDAYDQAAETLKDYEATAEALHQAILDGISKVGEQLDDRLEQYNDINDALEHQRDIVESISGDKSYEAFNQILSAQRDIYSDQLQQAKWSIQYWEDMSKGMDKNSSQWKAVQEEIKKAKSNAREFESALIDINKQIYDNNVKSSLDAWTKSILGDDLDWVEQEWELINRNADYYLDQTNAAYETQKLQNKYLDLLDQTDDLNIQSQITAQMKEQLGYLRDKNNLSAYDVAYANAQLEILQKRIALEDAQKNKNQIKLKRDAQGNYSYVYTANQDDARDKQNDLLDAENNAYNLSKEQMKQTQADSLSAIGDARNLLESIWTDANLTMEQKSERAKKVLDSLKEYIQGTSEQLGTSQTNIVNDFMDMFDLLAEENQARLQDVHDEIVKGNLDAFDKIDTRWSTAIADWLYNINTFEVESEALHKRLESNGEDFVNQVELVTGKAEEAWDDVADSISNASSALQDLRDSQAAFTDQLTHDSGLIQQYDQDFQKYEQTITNLSGRLKEAKDKIEELEKKLAKKSAEQATNPSPTGGGKGNGTTPSNNTTLSNADKKAADADASKTGTKYAGTGYTQGALIEGIAGNIWTYGTWGDGDTRVARLKAKFPKEYKTIYDGVQKLFNGTPAYGYNRAPDKWASDGYGYYKKFAYSSFDTGGYTGKWGNDGKMAMLHEKELVLNATDTENILQAVDMMRIVTSQMKSGMLSGLQTILGTKSSISSDSAPIEQSITIHADFPGVSKAYEIEEAFKNLNDQALQYIYKQR